jgi:hypothetical protein
VRGRNVVDVTLMENLNVSLADLLTEGGPAGAGGSEPSTSSTRPRDSAAHRKTNNLHPSVSD